MRCRTSSLIALLALTASLNFAQAEQPKRKFGPHAVPVTQSREHLRASEAPDYWALAPFYVPQATGSACSLASVAMLLNALRGVPSSADAPLVTQSSLLEAVGREEWTRDTAEGGDGVTWAEFETNLRTSLKGFGLENAMVEVLRPRDPSPETLKTVRQFLAANERSGDDIVLVYFNQGVLTGDWDGPHIAPIGAFDAAQNRVLIMDVDREWYVPYWSPDEKLVEAMLRPAPAEHGALAGETGGLIRVRIDGAAP